MSKESEESNESRPVHAARHALAAYLKSGRDLKTIYQIPINNIDRYDVWQCVFEKENEAYAVLQDKEIHQLFIKYKKEIPYEPCVFEAVGTLAVCILEKICEFDSPLSLDKAVAIIIDVMGDDFIPTLEKEVQVSIDRRREIISKYFKKDNEWVGQSIRVQKAIENYKISIKKS